MKDTVTNKEREIEEIYSSLASSEATVESKELNKRLAELANENMMLKDEINNYRDIVSEYVASGMFFNSFIKSLGFVESLQLFALFCKSS